MIGQTAIAIQGDFQRRIFESNKDVIVGLQ